MSESARFSVRAGDLLPVARNAAALAPRKSSMPVLTHLLFTVKGSDLTVAAAKELDQVRAVCPCTPDSGDCALTVPAAQLMNLLNNIPQDTEVRFELKAKALHVPAATSSQKLSTFSPSDLPLISADDLPLQVTIPAKTLRRMLGETASAMGQQDVRAYLNSTLFEVSGNTLTLVATDSYRLAVVSETIEAAPAANTPVKGIVPRSAVLQLLKMLPDTDETLVIGLGEQKAAFSWGNTECVTSLLKFWALPKLTHGESP